MKIITFKVVIVSGLLSFVVWLTFYLANMPLSKPEISCVTGLCVLVTTAVFVLLRLFRRTRGAASKVSDSKAQVRSLLLVFALLATPGILLLSGCGQSYMLQSRVPRETARDFLVQREASGFGLYSYLLFGGPPDIATRDRYLEAIRVYLTMIESVREMTNYFAKADLNVTYLPITETPPRDRDAEWLLEHYDFARARLLLDRVGADLRTGPYIISVGRPLSSIAGAIGRHLYQDLSHVPPDVIGFWIKAFMTQAAQQDFWKQRAAAQWLLNLRTAIAIAATGFPKIQESLQAWVVWKP
jgi:hypothetical protein